MEAVTELYRSDLLVLRVAVERVRGVRVGISCLELRCTGDIAHIDEDVMVVGDVVVGTTFHRSAEEADHIGLRVFLVVVHTVLTPVVAITE